MVLPLVQLLSQLPLSTEIQSPASGRVLGISSHQIKTIFLPSSNLKRKSKEEENTASAQAMSFNGGQVVSRVGSRLEGLEFKSCHLQNNSMEAAVMKIFCRPCAYSESVVSNHCKLWQNFSDCNHVQCGSML